MNNKIVKNDKLVKQCKLSHIQLCHRKQTCTLERFNQGYRNAWDQELRGQNPCVYCNHTYRCRRPGSQKDERRAAPFPPPLFLTGEHHFDHLYNVFDGWNRQTDQWADKRTKKIESAVVFCFHSEGAWYCIQKSWPLMPIQQQEKWHFQITGFPKKMHKPIV